MERFLIKYLVALRIYTKVLSLLLRSRYRQCFLIYVRSCVFHKVWRIGLDVLTAGSFKCVCLLPVSDVHLVYIFIIR